MIFPHANGFELDDKQFIALWSRWFDSVGSRGGYAPDGSVPRLARANIYQVLVNLRIDHGLDGMCRLAVTPQYRNTMQATNLFLDKNKHLLQRSTCINRVSNRTVLAAELTAFGKNLLKQVLASQALLVDAEALIEADTEIEFSSGKVTQLVNIFGDESACEQTYSSMRSSAFNDQIELVTALVDDIERSPFQPKYRRHAFGEKVSGWSNRLNHYFWPHPDIGYAQTLISMASFMNDAKELANAQFPWSEATKADSITFAEKIFKWGGVPQKNLTAVQTEAVAYAALNGQNYDVPMNSGWTKFAAFLTAHLEPNKSQAIWDSRVSWSIVRRLDHYCTKQNIKI